MTDLKNFSPQKLFVLTSFPHKELFENVLFSWEALDKIDSIFEKESFSIQSNIEHVFLRNQESISIGIGCVIDPTVLIEGPCIIGNHVELRHGAYIRSGCIIGNHCLIGHSSEIVRSIVLNGAKIPHFNYVGDSIIGEDVNLGAGSKCANFKLDGSEILIRSEEEKFRTGRQKLGAIIGSKASIGCNTVLNPGTVVMPDVKIGPCLAIRGVILASCF